MVDKHEESERMSTVRRTSAICARVQARLDAHVAKGLAPGVVALVGQGAETDVVIVGNTAMASSAPMRRDSIFRISSLTKPVTAAAAMMLIENGTLRLDEAVDRLLPELSNRQVLRRIDGALDDTTPAKRAMTVEDLLTLRSGMGIVLARPGAYPVQRKISELKVVGFGPPDPASPFAADEWITRLGTLPLMAEPGEQWMYDTGFHVLGVLLARASGMSLPDFLRARIFEPLGMHDTGFFVPPEKLDRLVGAYRPMDGVLELYDAAADSAWKTPPAFADGAGGLVSTADDYNAFSRFVLAGGRSDRGRRLLTEASVAAMTTDHLTSAQRARGRPFLDQGRGWGFGMSVVIGKTEDGLPPGAFGWSGGLGTSWMADPQSGLSAILLTQTMFTSPEGPALHEEFWRDVFGYR
jgi:CubicO group peptidase (beta-lactamase class C family)